MDVTASARKHGIADADREHAVRNAIRVLDQGDRDLYIGTAQGTCWRWSCSTTTAHR